MNDIKLEDRFEELNHIITELKEGKGSIEDDIKLYADGMKIIAECDERIKKIEGEFINLKNANENL